MSNTIRFLKLTPDGTLTDGQAPPRGEPWLNAVYEAIGCTHVEAVRLGMDDGFNDQGCVGSMYLDGDVEGKPGLIVNRPAMQIVQELNGRAFQSYFGTALFFGPVNGHGDDVAAPDELCERIATIITRIGGNHVQ